MESKFVVKGMTCAHCAQAVSTEIGKVPGVQNVDVTVETGVVVVTSDHALDRETVRVAVDEAGFELVDD